jgi:hypothetical protein
MYSGYVMMAYFWALQADKAQALIGSGKEDDAFYRTKIQTAQFYFDRMLPRADSHRSGALAATSSVMQIDQQHFAFP